MLRQAPLNLAKKLGKTSAKYRWFTLVYLIGVFVVIPLTVFGLSIAGWLYLGLFFCPLIIVVLLVLSINFIKTRKPEILPNLLKNWDFLPEPLRSLKPYDKIIFKYLYCCKCCNKLKQPDKRILPEENDNIFITKF